MSSAPLEKVAYLLDRWMMIYKLMYLEAWVVGKWAEGGGCWLDACIGTGTTAQWIKHLLHKHKDKFRVLEPR